MSTPSAFFAAGGTMGARMRALDWSATPLGAPELWPQGLKAVVQIMLTSRFAMWMFWGPELTFFCNDAYLPTTGIKQGWVLGARSDTVWAEIWPEISPLVDHVLATGEATWHEALPLYLERSGFREETYHTFSYSPLADDEGQTAGMLCVVAEVTERVIGERQLATLRDSGARLAAAATRAEVMQALETSLLTEPHDLPFALAYLHDPAADVFRLVARHGVSAGAPAALPTLSIAQAARSWPATDTPMHVAPAALGEFGLDHWQAIPDQALVAPIAGAGGADPVGFLVAGLNPHRPFQAGYGGFVGLIAGQLAAAIARADDYERERARAEALAELDRAKTAFFSNISHEFRTPLTLMLGPLEDALADGTDLPSSQFERVATAQRNGVRLLRLVNGLLDFSRIEAGRASACFRATDIAAYTADLASTFRSACERAGLTLTVDCPGLDEPAYVDRDMWEKIVLNLLSNAFKFTLQGGIHVTMRRQDQAVELAVTDTGTGVPAAEVPRLFERFHRVEGAQGRSFEGSGIGLALVHDLIALHGGSVAADSTQGVGSSFRVLLPLGVDHLPPDQILSEVPDAPTTARGQAFVDEAMRWLPTTPVADEVIRDLAQQGLGAASGTGRVLLADDNADLRDYVGRLLQSRGYAVTAVANGQAALVAARASRPDLVLTDVMMPLLDGFGLLAAIRGDPALADLPVVMLSARAGEEAQVEGLGAGADDYLAKPFSAREMLARVAANLEMGRTRRQADAALRASELRLRGVLEGMAEGFMLIDGEFRVMEVNDAGLRLQGCNRADIVGKSLWDLQLQAQASPLVAPIKRAMAERIAVAAEHDVTWPRGEARWLDLRAYPTEDGGLAIFFRDVTDRRTAQETLRHFNDTLELQVSQRTAELARSQALQRAMFETSYQHQSLLTARGVVLDANATSLAAIDVTLGDIAGKPFWETPWFAVRPALVQLVRDAVTRVAAGGAFRQEVMVDVADGVRCFDLSLRPIRDDDGAVTALVSEAVDITQRRATEEQLRQAQKMEAVGQLTGGIAHDFNNLLTGISGSLELLAARIAQGRVTEADRYITAAQGAARRAAALTHRLLAFSRRQTLDPKATDINRLAAGMEELIRRTVGPAITLELVAAGGLWTTLIDPPQLENALLNLCINARDAMPHGGKLTIETGNKWLDGDASRDRDLPRGQYVTLCVSDTGSGMTAEVIARAFDPFFTTKPIGMGTGLGLSMVYGFARQSGGQVRIYSEPGQGTMVCLYLPRHFGATEEAASHDQPPPQPAAPSGETVLVVDDEPTVRMLITDVLHQLGLNAIEAADGAEGLKILRSDARVDLLVTDVGLPGGTNGRQMADAGRSLRPDLKVLFITGYAENAVVSHGHLEPGMHVLTKPFALDALAHRLRELIGPR